MKIRIYQEGIFTSKWLSKFINCWFFEGEKFKIEKLIYFSFFCLKKYFESNALFFFFESLERLKPWIGLKLNKLVKSKKKKIQSYPVILSKKAQYKKAIYWLVKSIQLRKEVSFSIKLINEITSIVFDELTNSLKKKKEYYNYAIMFKSIRKFKW